MSAPVPTLGFIGLGAMGVPMVERLLERGFPVVVWNRTPSRTDGLVAQGAVRAASPADLAARCDGIGLCLTDGAAVEAIARELLVEGTRARWVLDFSTIAPAVAVAIAARADAVGMRWIDCPVSGGPPAARAGALIGLAGGDAADLEHAKPMTDALFARVSRMGGSGAGQLAKLCNQAIVGTNLLVMAEALTLARAVGIDAAGIPAALAGGFADSKPLQLFGPRMASGTVEPKLGAIRLMKKDIGLALAQAHGASLDLPMLEQAGALYERVRSTAGMDLDDDISSIIRLYA